MNRLYALFCLVALMATGCTSVHMTKSFNGVRVDGTSRPVATVEIENSGWFLLSFIPLASGNVEAPNKVSCDWFSNTVTVENNLRVLKDVMLHERVRDVANLTSHLSDETYLIFLLSRRAYHTSAVLIQPEAQPTTEPSLTQEETRP